MGHSRIGILPASRQWNEVVRLIADGADVPKVADSTLNAAGRAFAWVQKDAGFREAVHLMVELALAAGHGGGAGPLEAVGASVSESTSLAEVAMVVAEELDRRIDATRGRSDLAEKAQGALVGAICEHVQEGLPTLFEPTREDVAATLNTLKRPKEFGKLSRSFFAKLTNGALEYFLSRTLGTHLGEGQRFATNNQMAQFKAAMKTASQGDISGLQQILAEHDAETLRMLTPEEKFDYEVRLAPTALRLRMQMGNFEPSEEEFRQIFRLQKAYEDEFSPLGLQSARPEDQQRRQAAQLERNRQMESALGAARYAEYQQQRATGQRQP